MLKFQKIALALLIAVSGCAHRPEPLRFSDAAPTRPPVVTPATGATSSRVSPEPGQVRAAARAVPGPVAQVSLAQVSLTVREPTRPIPPPAHRRAGTMTFMDAVEVALRSSEIVRVTEGGSVVASRATAYDVATAESRVLAALAEFDTGLAAEFYTSSINQPPNAFFGPGLLQPTLRDESSFNLALNKRWQTGARTSVAFNPDPTYLYLPQGNGSGFNPSYVGELEFTARQPLLRGSGLEINRAPIRIRRLETQQSAWEFKKAVMASVRSVAEAYWQLYAARAELASIEEVIPLLQEIVRLQEESYRAEWVIQADVAKAYAQLYDFEQRRLSAQSAVAERELRLRNLLNLPVEDEWTIVPISDPGEMAVAVDAEGAAYTAVQWHPDLVRQRLETKIRELEFTVARNGRLPNFDIRAVYRMNGLDEELGGTLQQMLSAEHSDWLVGFTFSVPLGNRQAGANLRAAELKLARANGLLQQEVQRVVYSVRDDVREIDFSYRQYTQAKRRRAAAKDWLSGSQLRYENPRPGSGPNWLLQSLNEYLSALRFHTESVASEAEVLGRYNTALIELEETKGTLLEFLNIDLASDPCSALSALPMPSELPAILESTIPEAAFPETAIPTLPEMEPAESLPSPRARPERELEGPEGQQGADVFRPELRTFVEASRVDLGPASAVPSPPTPVTTRPQLEAATPIEAEGSGGALGEPVWQELERLPPVPPAARRPQVVAPRPPFTRPTTISAPPRPRPPRSKATMPPRGPGSFRQPTRLDQRDLGSG